MRRSVGLGLLVVVWTLAVNGRGAAGALDDLGVVEEVAAYDDAVEGAGAVTSFKACVAALRTSQARAGVTQTNLDTLAAGLANGKCSVVFITEVVVKQDLDLPRAMTAQGYKCQATEEHGGTGHAYNVVCIRASTFSPLEKPEGGSYTYHLTKNKDDEGTYHMAMVSLHSPAKKVYCFGTVHLPGASNTAPLRSEQRQEIVERMSGDEFNGACDFFLLGGDFNFHQGRPDDAEKVLRPDYRAAGALGAILAIPSAPDVEVSAAEANHMPVLAMLSDHHEVVSMVIKITQ